MRNALGIFGLVAAAIVVALVSRYGFATSDTPLDGAIAAFLFAVIAMGGIVGPAVCVYLVRTKEGWAKLWGIVGGVLAMLALAINLSNSLGAIASRADKTLAERQTATDATKDARAAIARLTRQLGDMEKFTPATADDVAAARAAVKAAEKSTSAECGDGTNPKQRGPHCRTREAEEKSKRDTLSAALANKALTDSAEKANADLAAERRKLERAPAVASANPLADTLGRVFRMQAEDAATWQQVVTVVVVELLIAFALIAWELLEPKKLSTPTPTTQEQREPAHEALPQTAALLTSPERSSLQRFMLACLPRATGQSVMVRVIYARYQRWCGEQQPAVEPMEPTAFFEQFAALCERVNISMRKKAGKVHCVGVKLAA